jgi:hypothetical protein
MSSMTRERICLVAASASVLVFCAAKARAQGGGDTAAARVLFNEGRKLASQGKYDQACPKFEESLRVDFGIGTQFNLADCWEHIGRTASAWAAFLDVAGSARTAGQGDRERVARGRASALEPKLSRMIIEIPSPMAGLDVKRDGTQVGQASWGTPMPIDPGAHEVAVTAPGRKTWTSRVTIAAGASVKVAVPALEEQPGVGPAAEGPATAPAEPAPDPDTTPKSSPAQRTIGLVVGGLGVVGVGVGIAFMTKYGTKNDEAKAVCEDRPTSCPQSEITRRDGLRDEAVADRTAAYIGLGAGGVALVGGVILYLTAPKASRSGFRAGPLVGRGLYGASIGGSF